MNHSNVTKLKRETKEFQQFCLKMKEDYNFYYNSLETIEKILKEILHKIKEINIEYNETPQENEEKLKFLMNEKMVMLNELKMWQKESLNYINACNTIKQQLQSLGINNDNCKGYPESIKYSKIIRAVTGYYVLLVYGKTDEETLNNMRKQIKEEYNRLFGNESDLNLAYDQVELTTSIDSQNTFEASSDVTQLVENPIKEETIPVVTNEEKVNGEVGQPFGNEDTSNLKFDEMEKATSVDSSIDTQNILEMAGNDVIKDFIPEVDSDRREDLPFIEIEEESGLLEAEIRYKNYLDILYKRLDENKVIKNKAIIQISERIKQNEPYEDITEQLEKENKIYNVLFKEIQRINHFTESEKKDPQFNMEIPSSLEIEDIITYLIHKEEPVKKEEDLDEINQTDRLSLEQQEKSSGKMFRDLERIQKLRAAGFEKEEIYKIFSSLGKMERKKSFFDASIGKAFKWIKNVSRKTQEFILRNKRSILVTASMTLLSSSLAFASTEDTSEKEETFGHGVTLNEREQNQLFYDPYIDLEFGDSFRIMIDAMVSQNEYLDSLENSFYSPDTERYIIGFGLISKNGEVVTVRDEASREKFLKEGYVHYSVQAFDGFYNINQIVIQKGLKK